MVQAFNDLEKKHILTQAPTIQRASQRIILCVSLKLQNLKLYLRDISQAYVQSKSKLTRNIFIRAPIEMGIGPNYALKLFNLYMESLKQVHIGTKLTIAII